MVFSSIELLVIVYLRGGAMNLPPTRGKLVRDRVPEIIRGTGGAPRTEVLRPEAYALALREKLNEELTELLDADDDHRLEELADVLEVLRAFAANAGIEWESVETYRRMKKVEERGAFEGRIFVHDA
jgi:predicted house-cleaning noncanonical NTP pyrophosphatase (MazG superfamily)